MRSGHTLALLGMVAVFGLSAPASRAADVQGVTNDTITLGMHNALTGPIAVFGLTYVRVSKMAIDEVNAGGGINGRKINMLVEDDKGDPGAGVAATTKLMDRDSVFLVLGGAYTPVTLATFPRVIERNMIYWSGASSTPALTKPFQRLTFQAQLTLDDQAIPAVKLALSMKPKKIGFIGENNEYGKVTHDATVAELAKAGMKLEADQTIEASAASAVTQVLAMKQAGVDVIIHGGVPRALSVIIRELYKQGIKAPLVSFGGGSAASIFDLVTTEAPIEFYAISPLACQLSDPCAANFMAKWKAAYPSDAPLVWSAQGYAAMRYFLEGLRLAGRELTQESLIKAFETMPPFSDPLIPYPMKATATNHRAIQGGYLDGFKDGKHYFFGDEIKN